MTKMSNAAIDENGISGTIRVAGTIHNTAYRVAGFNRRWDFGPSNDLTYDYALVIQPDGSAFYYDFSSAESGETVMSSQRYTCEAGSK